MTRRDRIIRLAKLRGDKAALAIMGADCQYCGAKRHDAIGQPHQCAKWWLAPHALDGYAESELRALWGDR